MSTKITLVHAKPMLTLSFYTEYQKRILNEYKYDNAIVPINSFYENSDSSTFMRFEDFSFDYKKNPQNTGKLFMIDGLLAHYSTIDSFEKLVNLDTVLQVAKEKKSQFVLFMYGDLKTFIFRFRFIFINSNNVDYKIKKISPHITDEGIKKEIEEHIAHKSSVVNEKGWFSKNNYIAIHDISSVLTSIPIFIKYSLYEFYPTNDKSNQIVLIKGTNTFLFITIDNISIKEINQQEECTKTEIVKVDLKNMFNPESIAENAVDLNINLMKWRMCPHLNTDIIKSSKYLLIGSGTLGCHVARCLLGWGARHITFVDNGKVSYSNPVRQSLYDFEDSKNVGENYKAILAAKKLKQIFPMADSKGFNLNIPLPGRTLIDETAKKTYMENLELLEEQIKSHDIIFLLTDSRESRWFPTVIATANNKKVITAAIGFDSYLVMRHGTKENNLGCYFCTDIVSPTDTSGSRTLDQQCTISRPGVSMICSGMAIELAMSLMNDALNDKEVPHQIRGSLLTYSMQQFSHGCNKNCVACSEGVINDYKNNRDNFIVNIMNDPYYIEKISGVEELIKQVKLDDICNGDKDDF